MSKIRGGGRSPRGRPRGHPADLRHIVAALMDRKAIDPVVLDLRGISEATDYFVIASGTSDAHVRGMAEHLIAQENPHHVEGLAQSRWVLLDYVDVVVHLFHPELREFYQLERLWADAPALAPGEAGAVG
jgi:ribosome-associated protein